MEQANRGYLKIYTLVHGGGGGGGGIVAIKTCRCAVHQAWFSAHT